MCWTYDKSKGGDIRELQSRMVPPPKKLGRVTLSMNQLILVFFFIVLTSNSTRQMGPDLAFGFVNKRSGYEIRDFIDL